MFRKSIFLMLFVCLLSSSSYAFNWGPATTWHGDADANWFNPANWYVSETDPNAVPDINYHAIMEPKWANPIIEGDAACGYLNIMPWSWSFATGENGEWGVDMVSGTFDCNYGISIGAWGVYGNQLDTTYGIPRFRVYDGTVRQTNGTAAPDGILIGGGDSGFRDLMGKLYMYGGTMYARRLELRFGEINLFGGTLECNDVNFIFYQNRPQNKINVNGGTLKVEGDHTAEFNGYIASKRMVAMRGGEIGSPVYSGGYTTITGTGNMNVAWNPVPEMNGTNVHYRDTVNDVNIAIVLSWSPGDGNVEEHDVYFGTSFADVNTATKVSSQFMGTVGQEVNEPCFMAITYNFKIGTTYYWRVDEEVNNVDEAGVSTWTSYKGKVWKFTTHDGKAYNTKPGYNAQALTQPFALTWTAGDFAADTMGHKVYFASASGQLNPLFPRPTDSRYRGQQTGTSYPLTSLSGAYTLVPGNTYYWAVDEIASDGTTYKGPELKFTVAAYINIDDFEDYNSIEDLNANWLTNYTTCPIEGMGELTDIGADRAFIYDGSGKYMRFTYTNLVNRYFSENKINYGTGTSFTGSPVLSPALAAIAVTFRGFETNPVEPDYDRMYMALEDTAGNVGVVYNPDPNAQRQGLWTQWFVAIDEFTDLGVNVSSVKNFFLGMGQRCNWYMSGGGDGNVMFDNIRLYAQTCNPGFAHSEGLTADFDSDCDVDVNDLDVFATYWLQHADDLTYSPITAPKAPVLWYQFNDNPVLETCADSSGNGFTGTVQNWVPANWDTTGDRSGGACFFIPVTNPTGPTADQSYIIAPATALSFMDDANHSTNGGGITFSVWANASLSGDFLYQWPGIFGVWDADGEQLEVHCPSRLSDSGPGLGNVDFIMKSRPAGSELRDSNSLPLINFGGRWNHWAFVKAASNQYGPYGSLKAYCNGKIVAQRDANGMPGDPNALATGPLLTTAATEIRIGTRGGNWGMWSGRLDDFKIYDAALTDAEVQYLATDGTGHLVLPLSIPENLETSGTAGTQKIDLKDMSKMCDQWHQMILWP